MDILAPLSGLVVPLDAVPDEVFAARLVGDGLAIEPLSNEVRAPLAGKVTQLHAARHAVAIIADDGLEVLVHVGIDTVKLGGEGFEALVTVGQRVNAGDLLLRFDADVVAQRAKSLVTVVLATNLGDGRKVSASAAASVTAGTSLLFSVAGAGEGTRPAVIGPAVSSAEIELPNPSGLHARPAAVLAQKAKQFEAQLSLRKGSTTANLKSVVGIMGLSTKQGDRVVVEAMGPDATAAVTALTQLLRDGSGEASKARPSAPRPAPSRPAPRPTTDGTRFEGVSASPGLALGHLVQLSRAEPEVAETGGTVDEETKKLDGALAEAKAQLEKLIDTGDASQADIIKVQVELLEDPGLADEARVALKRGASAGAAWKWAYQRQATTFEGLDAPLLRERAVDVRDVGVRVLHVLAGAQSTVASLPDDAIVVADELTPTQLAQLDATKLKGLVTTTGSATSHVSILARGMGVPSVVGVDDSVLALAAGLEVLLDGTRGVLTRAPAVNDVEGRGRLSERLARQTVEREQERAAAFSVGQTRDGVRIEVLANIKGPSDAREAMAAGAEGVGLLRSEFLFFDRDDAPSEAEQAESYRAVAEAVGPRHALVVRTLDVGGDKPLPYLPLPKEGNPFLGLRGIRVSLDRPELFRAQLRAILSAAGLTQLHVMFPMISGLEELRAARAMLDEERAGKNLAVKVGIMVEVPSAVVLAEALAAEADFFSIGTNDLTQYALAMDRGHPQLARRADALHPAVLRMIGQTVDGARKHDRPVHVCGGIASDALAVPVLVGLGVTELSVSVPAVASVKATLAKWSLAECRALATEALEQTTTAAVRALLETRSPGRLRGISVIAAGA